MQDVYWTQEGRSSLDAAVVAAAFAALVVLGTKPFGLDDPASIVATALAVALVLGLALMCFAKGRVLLGVIGLFVPVVALVGALRLAHPSSPWARRRYSGPRLEPAEARFDPTRRATRWERRIADLVAGAPSAHDRRGRQRRGPPTHRAAVRRQNVRRGRRAPSISSDVRSSSEQSRRARKRRRAPDHEAGRFDPAKAQ